MKYWSYEVRDNDSNEILLEESGFESESDAELQGSMEAKVRNLKNFYVRTVQKL